MSPLATPAKAHGADKYRSLFLADRDLDAFMACLNGHARAVAPAWVRVRAAGGLPMLVRPGTTDARVLEDTFIGLYHLPPGPMPEDAVILDLGANVGYTAAHLAALHPKARIIALELDGGSAATAQRTLAPLAPRVTVLHAAAWDRDGTVWYGIGEEWGFAAGDDAPAGGEGPARSAPAMTVDRVVERFGLSRIDYAKIDIEGGEGRILRPDAAWLRLVRMVKVEVHPPAATMDGVASALRGAGFRVKADDRHWSCLIGER